MDFDADGKSDLLVGCFEGFVYLLPGGKDGGFGSPKRLKDSAGKDIHFGEFWDYENKKWAEDKVNDQGNLCVYPDLVDWDDDGDLDLLFGGYQGNVGLRLNEGSASEPKFSNETIFAKVGKELLKIQGAASPDYVDWDGDGLKDLVVGGSRGGITFFKNTGKKGAPVFAEGKEIAGKGAGMPNSYLRINSVDFDGDGDLDLLVGAYDSSDYQSQKPGIWFFERK